MATVINSVKTPPLKSSLGGAQNKPELIGRITDNPDLVHAAFLLPKEDGVITVSADRSVRVWLKRETGQYWPSICHFLPSGGTCLDYKEQTRRLFVGQDAGSVSDFTLAEDFNSIRHTRDLPAHSHSVTAVRFSLGSELVLSTGKDKNLVWYCSESARKIGSYSCAAQATALAFDAAARYAFVGDYSGCITVLKFSDTGSDVVAKLNAHTGCIRSLAWDAEKQFLFSASNDQLIIAWDIGSKKGTAYELNGHKAKVSSLAFAAGARRLFSASDGGDKMLVCWDMRAQRKETPEWQSSDNCQRCDSPFFWNVKHMWERKVFGLRQHHCRTCGRALCDKCCQYFVKYPPMGYELEIRVCQNCQLELSGEATEDLGHREGVDLFTRTNRSDSDQASSSSSQPLAREKLNKYESLTSLALFCEAGHSVVDMALCETAGRLVTVGSDRIVKIWDVRRLVNTLT